MKLCNRGILPNQDRKFLRNKLDKNRFQLEFIK